MSLLEIKEMDVYYGAIHALQSVSLTVEPSQIVALIGSNGAGKSSVLKAISGLVSISRGSIRFGGKTIARNERLPTHEIMRLGIAHVPEGRGIFADLTVEENLQMGAYIRRDSKNIRSDLEQMLVLFPRLKERFKQSAGTLSGGEQQMLAISRALLGRPTLLLMDEPSLGLSPQFVQLIFKIIQEINQKGTSILLVEQNAHMALNIAHYAYVLEAGRLVMHDDAKTLAASPAVRKAYLGN